MKEGPKTTMRVEGSGAFDLVEGMPLAEYREVRMSQCLRCDINAQEGKAGVIISMRVVNGVIFCDTVCYDCLSPEERQEYQDVIDS